MKALNRRNERKLIFIDTIKNKFQIEHIRDWTGYENDELYLEGTGSMVLDRVNRIVYTCLSERTEKQLLLQWCREECYTPIVFHAYDEEYHPIYHTNVMMSIAEQYAVVCMESIQNPVEKNLLKKQLYYTHKELVEINEHQMKHFAGNVLQVKGKDGELLLVMSTQAYNSLTNTQRNQLENYNRIIHCPLNTIETYGGGGARCMLAEIFE